MKEYEGMHDLWRRTSIVLGPDDEATSVATGNSIQLLYQSSVLHLVIRTAMATSLISYQLNKVERKL